MIAESNRVTETPNKIALVIYAVILVLILLIVLVVGYAILKSVQEKNKKENK